MARTEWKQVFLYKNMGALINRIIINSITLGEANVGTWNKIKRRNSYIIYVFEVLPYKRPTSKDTERIVV